MQKSDLANRSTDHRKTFTPFRKFCMCNQSVKKVFIDTCLYTDEIFRRNLAGKCKHICYITGKCHCIHIITLIASLPYDVKTEQINDIL